MQCAAAATGGSDGETYTDAHQPPVKTGKPMLVMVSTEWCPACQVMKRRILPQIRERGLLSRVAFANVNPDQEGALSHQLIGNGPIPELVMYRKTPRGWIRRVLIGSQSVENVEQFINEGTVRRTTTRQRARKRPKRRRHPKLPTRQEHRRAKTASRVSRPFTQ